jgi:hypothetical protein
MKFDDETWLELGFAIFGMGLLAGIIAVGYGRAKGRVTHSSRRTQKLPAAGSVSGERHRNIQTTAAR